MARKDNSPLRAFLMKTGKKSGSICPVLARQDMDFICWLIDRTPEGSTVAETVIAFVLDVWFDEQEKAQVGKTNT